MSAQDEWLKSLPDGLRQVVEQVLRDQNDRVFEYLAALGPELARCDAEAVVYTTLTRLANGLDPHPELAIAAIKLLEQVLSLRKLTKQA